MKETPSTLSTVDSKWLERVRNLPTLPAVPMRVGELINDPRSSGGQIAEVLRQDQVLTARILKLVNSSYYSIPGGVADVQRALAFLGFNTLAQLVLGLSIVRQFPAEIEAEGFSMSEFWRHALGTAVGAEVLARHLKLPKPEEAFTCGLLHDVGKLVLHVLDPKLFAELVRDAAAKQTGFIDVERARDLPTHAFLGEQIAAHWGLPQVIRLAIRYHHHDVRNMTTILSSARPVIQCVRLANQLCVKNGIGQSGDRSLGEVTADMIDGLGLGFADLPGIEIAIIAETEKAGAFLSVAR